MDLKRDIKPITYMKNHAAELVRDISETGRTVVITQNGEAKIVLMDARQYSDLQNSIAMLQMVSMGETEIQAGKGIPQDKVFTDLERMLDDYEGVK